MQIHPWPQGRIVALALAASACFALPGTAHAQWKWRDGQGQIHVSDIPPPRDVPDKDVLQRPEIAVRRPAAAPASAAASSALAGKPAVDPELDERKRRAEQEQEARRQADEKKTAAVRQDNCRRAREQLATLESGQRMARVDASGERIILDDAARAQESQRARQVIASECR